MKRTDRRGYVVSRLLPFVVGLPLFVNVLGAGLIQMGKVRSVYRHESGQTVPISLFVVVLAVGFLFTRSLATGAIKLPGVPYIRTILRVTVAFICLNVLAFLIGQIITSDLASAMFLTQLTLPILAMYVIMYEVRSRTQLTVALQYASAGILIGVLATIGINILHFGKGFLGHYWVDNYRGVGIYQLYGYVPNVFATFTPILFTLTCVSHSKAMKLIFGGGLLMTILVILHLPSFAAILILGFGLLILLVGMHCLRVFRVPFLAVGSVCLIPIALWLLLSLTPLWGSISSLFDLSSSIYRGSVQHRLDKIAGDGLYVLYSPIVGKAYRADYGSDLPGIVGTRIAKPHNQFIDIGLRAGLFAVLLFIVMISIPVVACLRGLRMANRRQDKMIGLSLFSSLVPSITVHNMILVPYTQPYSGIVLYMLGGLALSYYGITRRYMDAG